jgi:Domain of unknown function (DUF4124)
MKKLCLLLAVVFAPTAGASYKCVDEKGITRVGDTPPDECAHVVMFEVSPSGTVLRRIEAPPTAEQVKALKDGEEKRKEAERAAAEQKRKDEALLSSFGDEREFDVARARNIDPVAGRIQNSKDRIVVVEKRIKELEDEMEFYKAGKKKSGTEQEPSAVLLAQLERATSEKDSLEKGIAASEREIVALKEKFDSDKKRWLALKAGGGAAPAPAPAAAPSPPPRVNEQKSR